MNWLLYIITGFLLIVLKTTAVPVFSDSAYDILIPFIVYLSIFRDLARYGICMALFWGLLTDSISGTPFGMYLLSYIWIFLIIRRFSMFLDLENIILYSLSAMAGVLIQNILFLFSKAFLIYGAMLPHETLVDVLIKQTIWSFFTGGLIILILKTLDFRLDLFIEKRKQEKRRCID